MRILAREKHWAPYHLAPGDTIELHYTDENGRRQLVAKHTTDKSMVVDTGAVVEWDEEECAALGLKAAIGGLFGESL